MGIGPLELAIIAAIALMVLGPDKFPDFARIVARTVRDLRQYVNEAQRDLSQELKPVQKELDDMSRVDAKKYIESLADEDQDSSINPEPDYTSEELYRGEDLSETKEAAESEETEPGDTVQYGAATSKDPSDEDSEQEYGYPERLDG